MHQLRLRSIVETIVPISSGITESISWPGFNSLPFDDLIITGDKNHIRVLTFKTSLSAINPLNVCNVAKYSKQAH